MGDYFERSLRRRNAVCLPTLHLYVAHEQVPEALNKYQIKVDIGELVRVLEDNILGNYYVVQREDGAMGRVPRKSIKPMKEEDVHRQYTVSTKNRLASYNFQPHILFDGTRRPLPHFFEVMTAKEFEFQEKKIVVFFIKVRATSSGGNVMHHNANADDTWIIAKTYNCFLELRINLVKYLGNSVPDLLPKNAAKPSKFSNNQDWWKFKAETITTFLNELASPRRGLMHIKGDDEDQNYQVPKTSSVSFFPTVDKTVLLSKSQSDAHPIREAIAEHIPALNTFFYTDKIQLRIVDDESVTRMLSGSNDAKEVTSVDQLFTTPLPSSTPTKEIHGLQRVDSSGNLKMGTPLNLTSPNLTSPSSSDQISPRNNMSIGSLASYQVAKFGHDPSDGFPDLSENEFDKLVSEGKFEISPVTPIQSVLRIWSVSSFESNDKLEFNTLWELDENDENEKQTNPEKYEENPSSDDESEASIVHSNSFKIGGSKRRKFRFSTFPIRAARASITALALDGPLHAILSKKIYPKKVKGVDSIVDPTVSSLQQPTATFMLHRALSNLSNKLKDSTKEARSGLNAFSQYSLSSLVSAMKKKANEDGSASEVPATSMASLASFSSASRMTSAKFLTIRSHTDVLMSLNERIQMLAVSWEKRRLYERQREQDVATGQVLVGKDDKDTKTYQYRSSNDKQLHPFPAQMANLHPLSNASLTDWVNSRSKTRLSRKSDRVVKMERMTLVEKFFGSVRVTLDQLLQVVDAIEQDDERCHAVYLLVPKLTDVCEYEGHILWTIPNLTPDALKRAKTVCAALAAEARAENNARELSQLMVQCEKLRKNAKAISKKIPLDYAQGDIDDTLSTAPKPNELKQDILTLKKLITEIRELAEKGSSFLNVAAEEQTKAASSTVAMKKLVAKAEEKDKSMLIVGRPEYVIHSKLKLAMTASERARTLSSTAVDEAVSAFNSLKRCSLEVEEINNNYHDYAKLIQKCTFSRSLSIASDVDDSEAIDFFDENEVFLERMESRDERMKKVHSSHARGWRKEIREVFADNYQKFKSLAGLNVLDNMNNMPGQKSSNKVEITLGNHELIRMYLLVSKIPHLRDRKSAIEQFNDADEVKYEDEYNGDENDGSIDDADSNELDMDDMIQSSPNPNMSSNPLLDVSKMNANEADSRRMWTLNKKSGTRSLSEINY